MKISYWDSEKGEQCERDATPKEIAQAQADMETARRITVEQLQAALTEHLDQTAQTRNWDNRITCMVRAGFDGPFRAEAAAFATWADTCNATAYRMLAEVQAGKRGMPKTVAEFLKEMPEMKWP